MEIKDRLICTQCSGAFSRWIVESKPARLVLPETRPTIFGKIPWGGVELNETQTNLES